MTGHVLTGRWWVRKSSNYYELDGAYAVARFAGHWRWHMTTNLDIGGEWRATRREAMEDVASFIRRLSERVGERKDT